MRNFVIDPPSEISGISSWIVWGRRSEGRQVPKHLQGLHYKYGIKNTTDLAQKYPCFIYLLEIRDTESIGSSP
jgi:hypothetical protein